MLNKKSTIPKRIMMVTIYKLIASLLIIILIVTINSFVLRNLFMRELTGRILTQFDYSITASDEKLSSVRNILTGYISDTDISFISSTVDSVPKGESLVKTLKVINKFSKDSVYNNMIENIYLYFKNSEWVINKNEAIFEKDAFLNKLMVYENNDFAKHLENISTTEIFPKTTVTRKIAGINSKTYESITFITPINSKCIILASVNSDKFIESVYLPEKDEGGHFLITDNNNKLVTYNSNLDIHDNDLSNLTTAFLNNKSEIQSKNLYIMQNKYIAFYKYSPSTNLKYYLLVPSTLIDKQVLMINLLLIGTFIFSGMIIILIYYTLKKDIYIPVTKINNYICNLFPSENKVKNDMEYIYSLIEKLHNNNIVMMKNSERQKSMINELFIRRIIEGNAVETEMFAKDAIFDGIGNYLIIYLNLEIYNDESYDFLWNQIVNEIKSKIDIHSFQINRNEMYCISNVHNNNSEINIGVNAVNNSQTNKEFSHAINQELKSILYEIISKVSSETNIYLVCGISRTYSGHGNLKRALDESKNIVLYRCESNSNKNAFEYDEAKQNFKEKHPDIQISLAEEMELDTFTGTGSIESVQYFFKTKYEKLNTLPFIIIKETYKYLFNMAFVIIKHKLNDDKKEEFENSYTMYYNTIEKSLNLQFIRKCVENLYYDIVVQIKNIEEEWKTCKIVEYVNHNYYKNDFCLGKIAEEFNVTTSYISTYLKKATGQNFTYYVSSLKVEKAKALLRSTSMCIKDISDDLGFTHPKHFIRLFKQFEGTTPGSYRKLIC